MADEIFTVPELIREQIKLLRLNQERLGVEMNHPRTPTDCASAPHIRATMELAKAVKVLGEELRQWAGTENKAFDKLTPARKLQAIVSFIASLPRSERLKAYKRLVQLEAELPVDNVALSIGASDD